MVGRAVAYRLVPVKARRNSFAGLVELIRFAAAREGGAIQLATDQQTMPGSVRQSANLDRDEPERLCSAHWAYFLFCCVFMSVSWKEEGERCRAVAFRIVPIKDRRNSFAGLVMLNRCVIMREAGVMRLATVQQTMPGSVRQSANLDRNDPERLSSAVEKLF
jgi:hypothetical protein